MDKTLANVRKHLLEINLRDYLSRHKLPLTLEGSKIKYRNEIAYPLHYKETQVVFEGFCYSYPTNKKQLPSSTKSEWMELAGEIVEDALVRTIAYQLQKEAHDWGQFVRFSSERINPDISTQRTVWQLPVTVAISRDTSSYKIGLTAAEDWSEISTQNISINKEFSYPAWPNAATVYQEVASINAELDQKMLIRDQRLLVLTNVLQNEEIKVGTKGRSLVVQQLAIWFDSNLAIRVAPVSMRETKYGESIEAYQKFFDILAKAELSLLRPIEDKAAVKTLLSDIELE